MQRRLDSWLQHDWEVKTKAYEKKEKAKKAKKGFLQYYIDKAAYYNAHKEHNTSTPHYKRLDELPAVGKKR